MPPISPNRVSAHSNACSTQQPDVVIALTAPPPVAYSIAAAVQATGNAVSRTRMFELIRNGEVDARKVGRRTIIVADSLREYLARQPRVSA